MARGGAGPRQPGGGRGTAGPRPRGPERPGGRAGRPGKGRPEKGRAEFGRGERPSYGKPKAAGPGAKRRDGGGRPERFATDERPRTGRNKDGGRPDLRFVKTGARRDRARDEEPREEAPTARAPSLSESRGPRRHADRSPETVTPEVAPAAAPDAAAPPTAVQTVTVTDDEAGMRVDRFFEARFPGLSFSHIQRIVRKGEVRVNGKRVDTKDRLEAGQAVRVPPLRLDAPSRTDTSGDAKTRDFLASITLFEDADVLVLNKPMGLAVQGGSGTTRHVDGMLEVLRDRKGQRPRLVHRLDKDTAGCLLVAKTRFAASTLAKSFRSREARKIYWALAVGVPKPRQGRISTYLVKEEREDESIMRVAKHGEEGASHAVTYYAVVETAAQRLAWLSLKPVTGRTHQLRAHLAHIGHPIVGDPKYFSKENWQLPGGMQNRLHLMARRLVIPHPREGVIDVTAPIPPHMVQSWNLLGFDATRFDPIEDAPDED